LKLKLTLDGKIYEVEVEASEQESPHPVYVPPRGQPRFADPVPTAAPPAATTIAQDVEENKVCRSPVSGLVVRVTVQVGQTIQANDELMVLEAMKMETMITAPIAGKIARLHKNQGDSVTRGEVLVEFE
jgi:methylmalonyl-CoA carboxyltransferase small subunit